MPRALLVEDEPFPRAQLKEWLQALWPELEIAGEAGDGPAALLAFESLRPDVVFVDIRLPGFDGIELARHVAGRAHLVFVTAYDEHAIRAFDLNAIDYLLKPYDKDRLHKTLDRLRGRRGDASAESATAIRTARAQTGSSERLLVPKGEQLQLIDASSIHCIEADDNYVHVHTAQARYMLRRTLSDLLVQLGAGFTRIHKSVAVNIAEVKTLSPLFKGDHEVTLRSGAVLRLSRRFKDELLGRMGG